MLWREVLGRNIKISCNFLKTILWYECSGKRLNHPHRVHTSRVIPWRTMHVRSHSVRLHPSIFFLESVSPSFISGVLENGCERTPAPTKKYYYVNGIIFLTVLFLLSVLLLKICFLSLPVITAVPDIQKLFQGFYFFFCPDRDDFQKNTTPSLIINWLL